MITFIQDVASATKVIDRQGMVIESVSGTLFTIMLRIFISCLSFMVLLSVSVFIYNWITIGINTEI